MQLDTKRLEKRMRRQRKTSLDVGDQEHSLVVLGHGLYLAVSGQSPAPMGDQAYALELQQLTSETRDDIHLPWIHPRGSTPTLEEDPRNPFLALSAFDATPFTTLGGGEVRTGNRRG